MLFIFQGGVCFVTVLLSFQFINKTFLSLFNLGCDWEAWGGGGGGAGTAWFGTAFTFYV